MSDSRLETDSLGEVPVPADALYQAQTARALANFRIGGGPMPVSFLCALIQIKRAAAQANFSLGRLDETRYQAIQAAAKRVLEGDLWAHFPVDVYQTGSGTSSNMNANEVLATLATEHAGVAVHPNDHVNLSQSSNDVIPSAGMLSSAMRLSTRLLPAVDRLAEAAGGCAGRFERVVKTGRTHLMDAMPVTLGQEFETFRWQLVSMRESLAARLGRLLALPLGGTAVGTGVNCPEGFAEACAAELARVAGLDVTVAGNAAARMAGQEPAVLLAGDLNALAAVVAKIANDLRWMNSGPNAGLAEVGLEALQPGSSIMPGKVNPVLPEAALMVTARVVGNGHTVTMAGHSGNFQLNVMLPVIASTQLESIELLAGASDALTQTLDGLSANVEHMAALVGKNPMLVTALNEVVGYDRAAEIAKAAARSGRPVAEVAAEMTDISADDLAVLLDPLGLTRGG